MEAWQSYNQLPAATRELYAIRYRLDRVGLTVPASSSGPTQMETPTASSASPQTGTHVHPSVATASTPAWHAPLPVSAEGAATSLSTSLPPQADPLPPQSSPVERRTGLRSKDKLRLTERGQKIYRS